MPPIGPDWLEHLWKPLGPLFVQAKDSAQAVPYWLQSAVNLIAGGLSAVVGGVAGALLSETFVARSRQRAANAQDRAAAFGLQIKMIAMYSNLSQHRSHLGSSRVAFRGGKTQHRCQSHQAYAVEEVYVNFSMEELQAVSRYGSNELLNLVADLDRRYNAIAGTFNQYRSMWLTLGNELEGDVVGDVVAMSLTKDQFRRLAPKFATMDQMLTGLDETVESLTSEMFDAIVYAHHARSKAFSDERSLDILGMDGDVHSIRPDPTITPKPKTLK